MPGAHLFGWFGDPLGAGMWRKLQCNADGKLIIDPSEIFENDPTDNEHGKAPDSDWAHDHAADAYAHHAHVIAYKAPDAFDYPAGISIFPITNEAGWPSDHATVITQWYSVDRNVQWCIKYNATECFWRNYHSILEWSVWREVMTDLHEADAGAHHDKYTNLEAQTACKLNGNLYWSCAGVHFDATNPDSDDVFKSHNGYIEASADGIAFVVMVDLPDGATITGVEVFGNAAAAAEAWYLKRVNLSTGGVGLLADAAINTEDTTIDTPVVDNSTYAYYINTTTLDTNDRIHGARITYTI